MVHIPERAEPGKKLRYRKRKRLYSGAVPPTQKDKSQKPRSYEAEAVEAAAAGVESAGGRAKALPSRTVLRWS